MKKMRILKLENRDFFSRSTLRDFEKRAKSGRLTPEERKNWLGVILMRRQARQREFENLCKSLK